MDPASADASIETSTETSTDASTDTSPGSSLESASTDTSRGASTLTDSFPHAVATMKHPPATASQVERGTRPTIFLVFTRSETQG